MIRVFEAQTADEAWLRAAEPFCEGGGVSVQPSRAGDTSELLHACFVVHDPRQRWILSRRPALNPAFAIAEVVWILAGRNDAAFPNHWNPVLPRYAGEEDMYHGAYGHRLRRARGVDQLELAYQTLHHDPNSRQVVLQIWDAESDLPVVEGKPRAKDIPCNITSLLKVRDGYLEWMQVIRSNDLHRGVPHNIVQFTCLQEVMAGWLNVDVGHYQQLSDSLHVYSEELEHVCSSSPTLLPRSEDSLALPKGESEFVWAELERRMEELVTGPEMSAAKWDHLRATEGLPNAFRNLLLVAMADDARRRGWLDAANEAMQECCNPVLSLAWKRWLERCARSAGGSARI
jgi:thymidylate synthase